MSKKRGPRIVSGGPPLCVPSHINYGQHIIDRLQLFEDKEGLINGDTGERHTFRQLVESVMRVGSALRASNLKRGDVVAMLSENRYEYLVSVIASITCGAVVSTANVMYTAHELMHTLNIAKPAFIFCSARALEVHLETLQTLPYVRTIVRFGGGNGPGLSFEDMVRRQVDVDVYEAVDVLGQSETASILYSSGTTGLPKGVMLTHLNLLLSLIQMTEATDTQYHDRGITTILTIVPWHHAYGYMSTINLLCAGAAVVYLPRFTDDQYLQTIQKYKVNLLLTVPPLVVFLAKSPKVLQYDLSSVVEIWCGAAPLGVDIIEDAMKRLPNVRSITQGYGMTETSLAATRDSMVMDGSKAGSCGPPVSGVKMKVVDLETREILGPYQKGEICIKGPIVMKGYLNNAEATRNVFDEDGYLKTGDIGYYDDDDNFYVVDRVKELVKYKGFQVPPAEVEAVLLQHPGVADCGVAGKRDQLAGELPAAFVVRQPGSSVTEKELQDLVASKLSNPKWLRGGVYFVDEIPKNASGKVLRRVIRERLAQHPHSKL